MDDQKLRGNVCICIVSLDYRAAGNSKSWKFYRTRANSPVGILGYTVIHNEHDSSVEQEVDELKNHRRLISDSSPVH
jgi:hypothetical protein